MRSQGKVLVIALLELEVVGRCGVSTQTSNTLSEELEKESLTEVSDLDELDLEELLATGDLNFSG